MLISTRGRYALRILTDMAERDDGTFQPLSELAQRQGISEKYLESIMGALVKNGLLEGSRGRFGGYRFKKPAKGITVWEVLALTEGDLAPVSCQKEGAAPCERKDVCRSLALWEELDDMIRDYLSRYTVRDLARGDKLELKKYILVEQKNHRQSE